MLLVLAAISGGGFLSSAWAQEQHFRDRGSHQPYGGYCEGPRWGWYGARTPVTTLEDARKRLEEFFKDQDVVVGTIVDQHKFFKADIKDRNGVLLDQVIIHKRSGRIRSIL